MFGTVYRMQAQPGKKAELVKTMMSEDRKIAGAKSFYVFDTGSDELHGVAIFDDEKTYRANANDPEQDKWYRKVRALLVADPEWHDGTITPWQNNRN